MLCGREVRISIFSDADRREVADLVDAMTLKILYVEECGQIDVIILLAALLLGLLQLVVLRQQLGIR